MEGPTDGHTVGHTDGCRNV